MISNEAFCNKVIAMIGQPYTETDCIGVVRKAAGIRCQGTNWLWRSYTSSGKYRYLTERMERAPTDREIKNGMLVFRIHFDKIPKGYSDTPDCHHVGVIVGSDVIQSNPNTGVARKVYKPSEWDGCGWLKFVEKPTSDETPTDPTDPDDREDYPDDDLSMYDMIKALYDKFIID